MKKNDPIFGELDYDYIWSKDTNINFFGKEVEIALIIKGDEDGEFEEDQYKAYQSLMENWDELHPSFLQPILEYYKEKRHELGYDIAIDENYPLVETTDKILEMISLDSIVVPYAGIYEGRDMGVLFKCTWDVENGVGLRLLDEKVTEVGYQDVAN
ncbi:DUF6985 domain-containing protein [Brevibacillus porteri]|uniref:DUF2004 domain-containing protein n=1 Tax=Brevibacillus porteri TaxID=2126350 RepID=A0ABX5FSK7_9BACL|nr:DUF2004 domain-containing protein [Brevibacillus porteri]MED1798059.1 DUF2004 domain-containing protein [Brevibacillus porteri]MED2132106.1 DUF2004 domain-containing protein [Brevibacillus porteri]MED2742669.1 DUF2004 domain-containing protein [Brevibacillus porteri]MED2814145.1 DUF2004 domain-containing protein [Brevibacillus porteri]MED2893706.1 DUF2004 domain-containing protein [Brevibacillus porteri]